jgi:hypothetical protein
MSQNFTTSMGSGTIGGMKILAVKGVEKYDTLWAVRYTRLKGRDVEQGAHFAYNTQEEATAKHNELLDILQHHDGVYLGSKAKRKVKTSSTKAAR